MNALNEYEIVFLNWLQGFRNPFLDGVATVFSFICEVGWIWILFAIIMLLFKKYRKNGIILACALLLNLIICNLILKNAVARIRPYDLENAMYTQDQLLPLARRLTEHAYYGVQLIFVAHLHGLTHSTLAGEETTGEIIAHDSLPFCTQHQCALHSL